MNVLQPTISQQGAPPRNMKMKEQSRYLYENKGGLGKTWA